MARNRDCFSSRWERLGRRRRQSPAFQSHDLAVSPRSTTRTVPASPVLMIKRSPNSPSTLRRRKGELYMWFGVEIPVGSDPSGLAPSFRQSGRLRATSVDFERRRIRSLALPNYSCQPSASLVIPVNRPHACGAESILSGQSRRETSLLSDAATPGGQATEAPPSTTMTSPVLNPLFIR